MINASLPRTSLPKSRLSPIKRITRRLFSCAFATCGWLPIPRLPCVAPCCRRRVDLLHGGCDLVASWVNSCSVRTRDRTRSPRLARSPKCAAGSGCQSVDGRQHLLHAPVCLDANHQRNRRESHVHAGDVLSCIIEIRNFSRSATTIVAFPVVDHTGVCTAFTRSG